MGTEHDHRALTCSRILTDAPLPNSRQESPTAQDKESDLVFEGVVEEALPGSQFRIKLENGHEIIAYLSGRMRRNRIRVLLGDRVQIAVSPYDLTRGRITYRYTS